MAGVSLGRVRDRARSTFWLVPAVCGTGAVGLAIGLGRLDRVIGDTKIVFLFPGPPEGARSFLGAIISAMISFTGLVFSITVVVLVLTSGQFSPRVLRRFLRDRTIQWSLGIFVATFLYAMTVIREVLGTNDAGAFVPRVSVTVAFLFVLLSVGLFIHYIHHIANMIRVSSIIASLGAETRELLEARYPPDPPPVPPAPTLTGEGVMVAAPRPGIVVSVNEGALVKRASRADRIVVLVPRVGDFVPAAAPLLTVHGGTVEDARAYVTLVALDGERTMEQDVAFGFRQLVDIAEKALSPSVNDPTTACQALDVMHDLLRRLVTREMPCGRHADGEGVVRLLVSRHDVGDFLRVALAEVWHYGSGSTQVPERLTVLLEDLADAALPEHRGPVLQWLDVVREGTEPAPGRSA